MRRSQFYVRQDGRRYIGRRSPTSNYTAAAQRLVSDLDPARTRP